MMVKEPSLSQQQIMEVQSPTKIIPGVFNGLRPKCVEVTIVLGGGGGNDHRGR